MGMFAPYASVMNAVKFVIYASFKNFSEERGWGGILRFGIIRDGCVKRNLSITLGVSCVQKPTMYKGQGARSSGTDAM